MEQNSEAGNVVVKLERPDQDEEIKNILPTENETLGNTEEIICKEESKLITCNEPPFIVLIPEIKYEASEFEDADSQTNDPLQIFHDTQSGILKEEDPNDLVIEELVDESNPVPYTNHQQFGYKEVRYNDVYSVNGRIKLPYYYNNRQTGIIRTYVAERPYQRRLIMDRIERPYNNIYNCNWCLREFNYLPSFKRHILLHTDDAPFKCELCSKKFLHERDMSRHVRSVHYSEKLYHCRQCARGFHRQETLNFHMRTHTGENGYQCQRCMKFYSTKGSLLRHILSIHEGEGPFKCEFCFRRFIRKENFDMHLKIHVGKNPFHCKICEQQFSKKSLLRRHLLDDHPGDIIFECDHCKMKFSVKYRLERHMRVHTREKPFQCHHCKFKFSRKDHMQRHILKFHLNGRPRKRFSCDFCNKRFTSKFSHARHLALFHKSVFKCNFCEQEFSNQEELDQHVLDQINVSILPKIKDLNSINDIQMEDDTTMYECNDCETEFYKKNDLKFHVKIHDLNFIHDIQIPVTDHDRRVYQCNDCELEFTTKKNLKFHIFKHH